MQFFPHDRSLFCLNWRATEAKGFPGTLFSEESVEIRYPEDGSFSSRGEDLVVVKELLRQGAFHVLPAMPHLYVYVSHGQNSWPEDHHRMLAERLSLTEGLLIRREAKLRAGLVPFSDLLGTATVCGSNGPAFAL